MIHTVFPAIDVDNGLDNGLITALNKICREAAEAAKNGSQLIVLSDKRAGKELVPISSLLALGAVHHHLIKQVAMSHYGILSFVTTI